MIAIVDYGMGNLGSVRNMLRKLAIPATLSADPAVLETAERLILPGVGSFDAGMRNLTERGLIPVLQRQVVQRGVPILGLCLGMQLMCRESEEGAGAGLGWIDARVVRFRPPRPELKVPHMGWNTVAPCRPHPLFTGLEASRFYFVHSFHVQCADAADPLGNTEYGYPFASAVARGNILGVQFHPEKSHRFGMALMRNFASLAP